MPYRVFTDFHHASLLNSFILLFEKRLGGEVFRPIGMEWFEKGFWNVYDHPATREQYLGIGGATPDGTPRLNEVLEHLSLSENQKHFSSREGVYFCQDIDSGQFNKAITFDSFMKMKFDIVIASVPQHIEPFKRLCEIHPNKPKLIYQIGNMWNIPDNSVKNVMASAIIPNIPEGVNFISYYQEFDLSRFYPANYLPGNTVYSFVNVFSLDGMFKEDWNLFLEVERMMDDYKFRSFGGQCRDGSMNGSLELSGKMRESRFIWHTKRGGDGFGHVVHNAGAVGRPMIVKKADYEGKLGNMLMIDGETCIDISNLSAGKIVEKIRYYSDNERYSKLCGNVLSNFMMKINYNREEVRLREFLAKLI